MEGKRGLILTWDPKEIREDFPRRIADRRGEKDLLFPGLWPNGR